MIILTFIAAIFHEIAAIITLLQFDIINCRDTARCTTHHHIGFLIFGAHHKKSKIMQTPSPHQKQQQRLQQLPPLTINTIEGRPIYAISTGDYQGTKSYVGLR
jgi:hypothetical protein